jgi:hypothetical protein
MAVLSGYNFRMSIGGTLLNGTTSHSIEETVEMLDATTEDSDGEMEYVAGEGNGTATVELKVNPTATYNMTQLRTAKNAKVAVACVMGEGVAIAGGRLLSFSAFINSLSETAAKGDVIVATVGLQKTGAAIAETTSSTTLL